MKLDFMKKKWTHSFSKRLFLCIFSTSFLLLLVGEIIMFSSSMQASTDINSTLTAANLQITGENLEQMLGRMDDGVQMAFSQKDVLSATQQDWNTDFSARDTIQHALNLAVVSDDAICHMALCSDEDGVLSTLTGHRLPYTDATSCQAYFDSLDANVISPGQAWYFLQPHPSRSGAYALVNLRSITPLGINRKDLLLVASISEEELSKAYEFLGDESFIMTSSGTIISAVNAEMIGSTADDRILAKVSSMSRGVTLLFHENDNFHYSVYLPSIDCYLVAITPASVLVTTKLVMALIAVVVILVGSLFSLCWSNYISGTMTSPLTRLKAVMEEARSGNLEVRCQPERQDEIGYLCESFNHMMDNLNTYIAQLGEQQNLAKANEIQLLQAQINPHLLYNTLDSALFLMNHNATEQSIQILEQLSQYFKLALQSGNKIVTVEAALRHVEAYLNLQNSCRMKNFTLTIKGEQSLMQARILHMLLQPIVENSVLHGFEGSFADGSIEIVLHRKGDRLVIAVTDDGMGMEDRELQALREKLNAATPGGQNFGMWNIAQRIRMFYGPEYTMQVDSEFGEFTTVTLELPFRLGDSKKEDDHV